MDRAGAGSKRLAFLSVNKRMDKLNGKKRRTMLPTKEEAMKLLEEGYTRNHGAGKDHSIIV